MPPLYTSFRSAATHPPAASVFARLRVAAGCGTVMLFAPTQRYPCTQAIAYTFPNAQSKKSRQPLCSSVSFRAFVEDQITKALHSTSHIASPRSSYLTAFRSSPLAPLAGGSQASVRSSLRLAWPFVHYAALHSLRPAVCFSCVPALNSITLLIAYAVINMSMDKNNRIIIYLDQFATSGLFDSDSVTKWTEIGDLLKRGYIEKKLLCPLSQEHYLETSNKSEIYRNDLNKGFLQLSDGSAFKTELEITSQLLISLIRKNNITLNTFLSKLKNHGLPTDHEWNDLSSKTKNFNSMIEEATSLSNSIRSQTRHIKSTPETDKALFDTCKHLVLGKFIACLENLLKNKFIKVGGVHFESRSVPNWIDAIVYRLVTIHRINEKETRLLIKHFERHGFSRISTLDVRTSLSALISVKGKKETSSDQLDISRVASGIQLSNIHLTDKKRKSELLELGLDKKYNTAILSGIPSDQDRFVDLLQRILD
ncbi:MAG: hypothetical protein RLO17_07790 [Cyclobacteriaceae bacterium]